MAPKDPFFSYNWEDFIKSPLKMCWFLQKKRDNEEYFVKPTTKNLSNYDMDFYENFPNLLFLFFFTWSFFFAIPTINDFKRLAFCLGDSMVSWWLEAGKKRSNSFDVLHTKSWCFSFLGRTLRNSWVLLHKFCINIGVYSKPIDAGKEGKKTIFEA